MAGSLVLPFQYPLRALTAAILFFMAGVGADLALVAATLPFIIGMDAFGFEAFLDAFDGCINIVGEPYG